MSGTPIFRTCPHCNSTLQITGELLQQAEGMLRCGNCLNIFDGFREEAQFIPPELPDQEGQNPLGQISVDAMSSAEMPAEPEPTPWISAALSLVLALLLAGQVLWQQLYPEPAESISLTRLVVRPHPVHKQALRVDAILKNGSAAEQQFPKIYLSFRDQYGRQQAQRSFEPGDYLHGELAGQISMPAQSSVQVSLSLQDPGRDANNYSARLQYVNPSSN
jgi:predicted Zn finger-like uncharacterized protein